MADSGAVCLLGTMDRLWFHQIILVPEPISVIVSKLPKPPFPLPFSDSIQTQSSMTSVLEVENLSLPSSSSISLLQEDECNKELEEEGETSETNKEEPSEKQGDRGEDWIPASKSSQPGKSRSHSPSLSTRTSKFSNLVMRLQKTMSCKSLFELEEEEVKGFVDLGFSFDKTNLCPRMMSLLPGLQRLGGKNVNEENDEEEDDDGRDDEERRSRPYLSEAWLIKRPDSPLLNFRVPKVSSVADMKKHIKHWAKTVASEIQQAT